MGVLTVIILPVLLTVVAAEAGQGAGAAATVPADWTLAETRYEGCRYHVVFERKDLSTEKCQEQAEEPSLSHIHNTIKAMLREGKPNNKDAGQRHKAWLNFKLVPITPVPVGDVGSGLRHRLSWSQLKTAFTLPCRGPGGSLIGRFPADINECTTSPCQHGRCENYPGGYRCTCSPGWTGKNCQQDINECIRNPCQHGSCVNKDGGYDCNCLEGWTGTNCQQQARPCQSGWSEYNNNCYKLFKEKVTWFTAKEKCKQHGANLASVGSAGENNFIARLITDAPKGYSSLHLVWFGLTLDGQWKWTDGSRLSYKNWAPHEPFSRTVFGRDEKCANLFSKDNRNQLRSWFLSTKGKKGQWNNDVCSNHHPYNRVLATCNTHLVQPQSRQCGLRMAADGLAFACCLSRHTPGLFQNSRDFLRFPTTTYLIVTTQLSHNTFYTS
ncbi:hypothetical protein Bbelb_033900 [Branchiostoma belcheri]|nr:hypothetical protein Bbelb_033900 [Branchiostoma belcheri]